MASLLSQALAPVFQALRARGRSGAESDDATSEGGQSAAPVKSSRGLPEIDYPVPLVVKNTFIDAGIGRPLSMDGFYLERAIHSTPVSLIEGAEGLSEVPFEPAPGGQHHFGKSAEQDGSASCTSTSVGSTPARRGLGESPGGESEASTLDVSSPWSPAEEGPARAVGGQRRAGLPEFEYPAPVFVKNTFIDTDIGRGISIDGFYEERQLRSCPTSALYAHAEVVGDASLAGDVSAKLQELESGGSLFAEGMPDGIPALPQCQPLGFPVSIPLPPAEPPVLPVELTFQEAPTMPPAMPAPAPVSEPAAPVLLLSDALGATALMSTVLPSVGSADHHLGSCKPCAHAYSAKGCKNGVQCPFCHLCPPGELKRQQKAKRWAQRKSGAA